MSSGLKEGGHPVLLTGAAAVVGLAVGPLLHRAATRLATSAAPSASLNPAAELVAAGTRPAPVPAGSPPTGQGQDRSAGSALALSALTGLLFVGVAGRFGADPVLPAYLYLVAVGLTLSLVDLRSHRLPNVLTLPSYPIAAGLLAAAALLGSSSGSLGRALLAGAASYLLYLALRLANPRGLGFGDVKLAGVLGMYSGWLGWSAWTLSLLAASLYAGTIGLALLALRRLDRRSHMALGPYLIAGTLTAALIGQRLLDGALPH